MKYSKFEVPPPGAGLVTVIVAVLGVAKLLAGTRAVSTELLTNVVANPPPFQFTVDPDTNPEPLTVSV
jgi:hypothetical protein